MEVPDQEEFSLSGDAVIDYLLYLQESASAVALQGMTQGIHGIGRVARLSREGVTIFCQNLQGTARNLLVGHYEPTRSLHFLLQNGREEAPGCWLFSYPSTVQVRQERKYLRYTLKGAVLASWHSECSKAPVRGDVVDIGLGGFLASIYMSSGQLADTGSCCKGDRGTVTLRREDQQQWQGLAELLRCVPLEVPGGGKKASREPEFVLLGFAFQFDDPQAMKELTEFFHGILGPIA